MLRLTVGVIGQKETVFDKPMTPAEIQSVVYDTIQPYRCHPSSVTTRNHFILWPANINKS
ncbi:hypothetical protein NQ314_000273 [Rhamnusium bicolor]|uniref:Uncharacterized protein n=1 Tax=Rhamnusium bicolor TaxID=1586634 RepID=A0AAV8ZUE2_9CUCU|nr:hypothetical protein NQ314_000273 [Rhamnusium bicolor]